MPQRIRPTDVTAAFRVAVISARLAGVNTEGWTLSNDGGAAFSIVIRDPETNSRTPVVGTTGLLGTTYRDCFDALHAMRAAWDLVPHTGQPGTWPCWHVEATNGLVYGVAATSKAGAFAMLNARLAADGDKSFATKGSKVATWEVDYATVFCYGEGTVVE